MKPTHTVAIRTIEKENPNIRHIVLDRPSDFTFEPGQAALIHLTKRGSDEDPSPFSPVSLKDSDFLEFHIKIYPERHGLTEALDSYNGGDEVEISGPIGKIHYKGPGTFFAAGTGITPFLSIFRNIGSRSEAVANCLYYMESTPDQLIAPDILMNILGKKCHFILT